MNLFISGADFTCIFILLIIAVSVVMLNKHEKKYVYYIVSVVSLIFFCLADCVAFAMDELGGNELLHFSSNLLSYAGVDVVLAAFSYYVTEKIRESVSFSRIHTRIVLAVCAIDMWFMIWGGFSGALFRLEDGKISYGPLADFVGLAQLIVSVYFLVLIYLYRKKLERKVIHAVSFYFSLPILAIILQFIDPLFEFTYVITSVIFLAVYVAVVQEDLQESNLSEKLMRKASVTDNLTGLFNRRAYAEDVSRLAGRMPSDLVFFALDVNGLKAVNDQIGHAAGDEIIVGAADCIRRVLGQYGKVYRTGGDEFIAIVRIPAEQLDGVVDEFENAAAAWHGKLADGFTISLGYVKAEEVPGASIHELSVLADKRMYVSKSTYYKNTGVNRRRQVEAHAALCSLYTKILRINITDDSYQIINMDESEQIAQKGFAGSISGWFRGFALSGQVHEDDAENFLAQTSLAYLQDYFRQSKKTISVFYRRRYPDGYKQVVMEMIPTADYTDDNQELFLYVKSIDN